MPFVWCLGSVHLKTNAKQISKLTTTRSIIGAGLGGALAEPTKSYPTVFKPDGLFGHFPYLLPNLVCTAVVVLGLVVGILFLEETHEDKKFRRDIGIEAGRAIKRVFRRCSQNNMGNTKEKELVLSQDEKRLSYQSTDSCPMTPRLEPPDTDTTFECDSPIPSIREKLSWRQGFTKQVMLIIVGYGILALYAFSPTCYVHSTNFDSKPHDRLGAIVTHPLQHARIRNSSLWSFQIYWRLRPFDEDNWHDLVVSRLTADDRSTLGLPSRHS